MDEREKELEELVQIISYSLGDVTDWAKTIQDRGYTKKHSSVEKLKEHIDDGIDLYDTMKGDTDFNRGMIAGRIASWIDVRDKIKELEDGT